MCFKEAAIRPILGEDVMKKEPGASQFFLIPVFVLLASLVVGRKRQERRRAKALPRHDNM